MSRTFALGFATSLAALGWANAAAAQDVPPAPPPSPQAATAETDDAGNLRGQNVTTPTDGQIADIIVTGTRTRGATVLTSSSAITVANRLDIDRKAPRSTAQALELIPGIFVEGSGGEASNNFSVRGLAGGGQQFVQLQEDGLPVFYINALSDTVLKQGVYIDRLEAVRSGSSGILTVNGAGATINFINKKPNYDETAGSFQLTTSSYGTARVDAFMTRPIAENTAISFGGFYRNSDGIRDPGFPADHGFQWRAAIGHRFESGGELILSAKVVDDHSTFYLPVPLTGVGNPQSIPGLNATKDTMAGRDVSFFRNFTGQRSGGTKDVNLRDGVHTRAWTVGYDLTKDFGEQFSIYAKGRYTNFQTDFNAFFSFDNDALQLGSERLNPAATNTSDRANQTRATFNRFAAFGATRLALRYVDTGQILDGAAAQNAINGNGLVAENVAANNRATVKEFNSDTGIRWQTSQNSLSIGALFTKSSRYNDSIGTATVLTDVQDGARRLDVVALNAQGGIVGYQTDRGVLNYGTWGEGSNNLDFESISVYAQDELKLLDDRLRIDGGIRYEHFNLDRRFGNTSPEVIPGAGQFINVGGTQVFVDNDNIIANNFVSGAANGTFGEQSRTFDKVAYTLGANYLITDRFAVYARYATGFQAQEQNRPTDLEFAEAGLRYNSSFLQATLSGFYTRFKGFPFSRASTILPERNVVTDSDIEVYGGEFDVIVRPTDWFRVQAYGVLQKSQLSINRVFLDNNGTVPPEDIANIDTFEGNRPERTPAINVTVTPSIVLPNGLGEIYGSYKRIGKIFADISNSLELPGYDLFSAGVLFNVAPNIQLNVSVENIGNVIGLTEGNPRGGFTENTGSNFYFGRPVNGRNAVASLRFDF